MDKLAQLLNYCATHPDATVRFTASDMLLAIESDASYLSSSSPIPRSVLYLTNKTTARNAGFKPNGAVHALCQIMREVRPAPPKLNLGRYFTMARKHAPAHRSDEMGHPQPATPMATDNSTASGIATDTVKQKRSKAVDMRFY
ncbi:Reverse transcriptase (RNA-dependent DNA polymerase) [Fragilaria crotonensis]|nr:Reverse transcriptase (RNA-dependent DNA polymerase) [Fragilaria crotonensis]